MNGPGFMFWNIEYVLEGWALEHFRFVSAFGPKPEEEKEAEPPEPFEYTEDWTPEIRVSLSSYHPLFVIAMALQYARRHFLLIFLRFFFIFGFLLCVYLISGILCQLQ